jgi:hypothetical protein
MIGRSTLIAVVTAVSALSLGGAAHAGTYTDFSISFGSRPAVERVWVEPVYQTRVDRVWVEPVYQTQCDRVWHEPVYEDRCDRVLVPDRFEVRTETNRDYYGRKYTREVRVLVEPAHYVDQHSQVLVRDGYYEDVSRQVIVADGHWVETSHQVCVSDGRWVDQPIACAPAPSVRIDYDRVSHDDARRDDRRDDRHDRDDRRDAGRDDRIGQDHDRYNDDRSPRNHR